ncbi:MAG: hypothetical protein ACRYG8_42345 [Janthinobacterium lividum]
MSRFTAATWRKRFAAYRLDGLRDEPQTEAPRDRWVNADGVTATAEPTPAAATRRNTRATAGSRAGWLDWAPYPARGLAAAAHPADPPPALRTSLASTSAAWATPMIPMCRNEQTPSCSLLDRHESRQADRL